MVVGGEDVGKDREGWIAVELGSSRKGTRLVPSVGLPNEYLWMINVLALESILALKALYIAVEFYHFPHGIGVQQQA